nr:TRAF3-interacting protein 1-like [Leptinotarsa decemlineata]
MKPVPKVEKGVELESVSTETFHKPAEKEVRLNNRKLSVEEPEAAAEEEPLKAEKEKSKSSSKSFKNESISESGSSKDEEKGKDRNSDKSPYFLAGKEMSLNKRQLSNEEPEATAEEELLNAGEDKSKSSSRDSKNSSSSKSGSSKDKEKSKDRNRDRSTYFPAEKKMSLKNRQISKEEPEATAKKEPLKVEEKHRNLSSRNSKSRNSADKKESRKRNKNESQDEGIDTEKDRNREKYRESKSSSSSKHRSSSSVDEKGRNGKDMRKSNASIKSSSSSSKEKSENLSLQLRTAPIKRPSPSGDNDSIEPPGKKLKMDNIDNPERLPPKLSAVFLRESSLFMDTIIAAATKAQKKKRQRTPTVTKDGSSTSSSKPTWANTSLLGYENIAPSAIPADESPEKAGLDTKKIGGELKGILLNAKKKGPKRSISWKNEANTSLLGSENIAPSAFSAEESPEKAELDTKKIGSKLKGILLNGRKKGPKRSISWKNESDLVEIRYFEKSPKEPNIMSPCPKHPTISNMTPSNNRINPIMFQQNSISEGSGQLSGKLCGVDIMKAQIMWRVPTIIEQNDPLVEPGNESLKKDIQLAREKSVLQTVYFKKSEIPEEPEEPIQESRVLSDPVHIPLEDPESRVLDFSSSPWPEPKGMAPEPVMQPVLMSIQVPFNPQFNSRPPPPFQGTSPRFVGPGGPMGPGIPYNFVPPHVMPGGNMMGPGPNRPNVGPPNDMMMKNQMHPNVFPQGAMFPHRPNHRRGGLRGGNGNNGGNWVRVNNTRGNWRRGGGGGYHRGGRLCKNVQNHGYCRNRHNCRFVHP